LGGDDDEDEKKSDLVDADRLFNLPDSDESDDDEQP
jgi:hypothetical protein